MRQLKNDGECKSKHTMQGDETDSPCFPSNYKRRKQDIKNHVQNLTHPKNEVIFPVHILNRGSHDLLRKIFYKIHDECPCNRRNGIYQGQINMLYTMSCIPFLRFALANQWAFCNIIIHSINIGVCVVNDIMLLPPEK